MSKSSRSSIKPFIIRMVAPATAIACSDSSCRPAGWDALHYLPVRVLCFAELVVTSPYLGCHTSRMSSEFWCCTLYGDRSSIISGLEAATSRACQIFEKPFWINQVILCPHDVIKNALPNHQPSRTESNSQSKAASLKQSLDATDMHNQNGSIAEDKYQPKPP